MLPTSAAFKYAMRIFPVFLLCLLVASLSACENVVCTLSSCTNSQNTNSSTPSSSNVSNPVKFTSGHGLIKVGGGNIDQGSTLQTIANDWTVVQGDVSYIDPSNGTTVLVKSAHGAAPDAQNVGSILAVKGSIKIIGTNPASYQLFDGSATDDQIKQMANDMVSALTCTGGCSTASI